MTTPTTPQPPEVCGQYIGSECAKSYDGTHQCELMGNHSRHRCRCGWWAPKPARPIDKEDNDAQR